VATVADSRGERPSYNTLPAPDPPVPPRNERFATLGMTDFRESLSSPGREAPSESNNLVRRHGRGMTQFREGLASPGRETSSASSPLVRKHGRGMTEFREGLASPGREVATGSDPVKKHGRGMTEFREGLSQTSPGSEAASGSDRFSAYGRGLTDTSSSSKVGLDKFSSYSLDRPAPSGDRIGSYSLDKPGFSGDRIGSYSYDVSAPSTSDRFSSHGQRWVDTSDSRTQGHSLASRATPTSTRQPLSDARAAASIPSAPWGALKEDEQPNRSSLLSGFMNSSTTGPKPLPSRDPRDFRI